MPRKSLAALIEARHDEQADRASSERFVDLQIDVYAEDAEGRRTDEHVACVGGRWDRRLKRYEDDARLSRVVSLHPGQLPFFRWFDEWLGHYLAGTLPPDDERIYSVLLGGGQRSGKTHVGILPCIAFALAVPGSIVWIVCPSDKDFEEVEDVLRGTMPESWYTVLGSPWFRYSLINGSKIVLRSGHIPEKLKKGDADFILVNEAQQIAEKSFAICRARIAAAGGLVVVAANPPDQPIGQWVGDFASDAEAGLRQARYFSIDPFDNPHIDHGPLRAMAKEFDEHTFNVEIRGMFLGQKNAVLYNWSRVDNERAPPAGAVDITREVTKRLEGREFDRVVSVDVQRHPHMASLEWRFFENPSTAQGWPGPRPVVNGRPIEPWPPPRPEHQIEWCWMWGVSEFYLKGADEEALATAWIESGWDPARTLVVCDASAEWQFAERDPKKLQELREKVKGRGSFDVFRRFGFTVVKPDRAMEKNPDVLERVRATTSRIKTAVPNEYGQRFLFVDPRCRESCRAIRNWANKNGLPMRVSQWAHGGDVVTYGVQRFFPRREPRGKVEVSIVKRSTAGARIRGW